MHWIGHGAHGGVTNVALFLLNWIGRNWSMGSEWSAGGVSAVCPDAVAFPLCYLQNHRLS